MAFIEPMHRNKHNITYLLINMVTIQKSQIKTYMPLTICYIFSHVPWLDTKRPFQCNHCFIIYHMDSTL